jgi:GDP-4-dehydro-6-deoxy-D-mannose reductase
LVRVLITGGTGFVGTHLIRFLRSRAADVAVLASKCHPATNVGLKFYDVDIRNSDRVRKVVREFAPHHVYHLAGISSVADSRADPRLTYEVNVLGACNLFEAAMSLPSPPRILNISTSQVYAASSALLTEDSPVRPENPYAASKAMAELVAMQYRKFSIAGIITARAFNHTGPGQSTTYVLPSIARQFAEIHSGKRPPILTIGDVNVRRDFTDVRDVVRAYAMLLEKGKAGEIYNVCSGNCISLAGVLDRFQALAGIKVTIESDPDKVRCNEVSTICGDAAKIRAATGWFSEISLERTILDLLEHWRTSPAGVSQ